MTIPPNCIFTSHLLNPDSLRVYVCVCIFGIDSLYNRDNYPLPMFKIIFAVVFF